MEYIEALFTGPMSMIVAGMVIILAAFAYYIFVIPRLEENQILKTKNIELQDQIQKEISNLNNSVSHIKSSESLIGELKTMNSTTIKELSHHNTNNIMAIKEVQNSMQDMMEDLSSQIKELVSLIQRNQNQNHIAIVTVTKSIETIEKGIESVRERQLTQSATIASLSSYQNREIK